MYFLKIIDISLNFDFLSKLFSKWMRPWSINLWSSTMAQVGPLIGFHLLFGIHSNINIMFIFRRYQSWLCWRYYSEMYIPQFGWPSQTCSSDGRCLGRRSFYWFVLWSCFIVFFYYQWLCYLLIGRRAEEHRGLLSIKYPMEHGIVTDWNEMEKIWHYIYSKEQLQTFSEEHPVLLTG